MVKTSAIEAFLKPFLSQAQLRLDSRTVEPGDVFIARKGLTGDGRLFLGMAQSRGAAGFIIEGDEQQFAPNTPLSLPTLFVPDLSQQLSHIASYFYGYPAERMRLYGVTGTNGKTSVTYYIAALHAAVLKEPCAVMGTLGYGLPDTLKSFGLTTPDVVNLQRYFRELLDQNMPALAMEVSSHGLDQGRIQGCRFESTIFTNLTQDHLDYHGDLEQYWMAKQRLFTEYESITRVLNWDDPRGQLLALRLRELKGHAPIVVYGLSDSMNTVAKQYPDLQVLYLDQIQRDLETTRAYCHSAWGEGWIETSLLGDFNLSNLLAALGALGSRGVNFKALLANVGVCQAVPGRMRRFGGIKQGQPLVVVDYAHTPDALDKILAALKPYCQGRLICVFGCGGERDRVKRPLMLQAVLTRADEVWVTQDNSRGESPDQIVADILTGNSEGRPLRLEMDREVAIKKAIQSATPKDVVLIAGKGHETVQIIGLQKRSFSDEAVVEAVLES